MMGGKKPMGASANPAPSVTTEQPKPAEENLSFSQRL
jgi:hypothetical protein